MSRPPHTRGQRSGLARWRQRPSDGAHATGATRSRRAQRRRLSWVAHVAHPEPWRRNRARTSHTSDLLVESTSSRERLTLRCRRCATTRKQIYVCAARPTILAPYVTRRRCDTVQQLTDCHRPQSIQASVCDCFDAHTYDPRHMTVTNTGNDARYVPNECTLPHALACLTYEQWLSLARSGFTSNINSKLPVIGYNNYSCLTKSKACGQIIATHTFFSVLMVVEELCVIYDIYKICISVKGGYTFYLLQCMTI